MLHRRCEFERLISRRQRSLQLDLVACAPFRSQRRYPSKYKKWDYHSNAHSPLPASEETEIAMSQPMHHSSAGRRSSSYQIQKLYPHDIRMGPYFDCGGFSDIYRGRWVDESRTEEVTPSTFMSVLEHPSYHYLTPHSWPSRFSGRVGMKNLRC